MGRAGVSRRPRRSARRRKRRLRSGGRWCLNRAQQVRHLRRVVGRALRQHVRDDLARAGVHGQVQLTPLPLPAAVLGRVLFTLAEQLQPGAVQHEVKRVGARACTGLPAGRGATAARERYVVPHGQIKTEQA